MNSKKDLEKLQQEYLNIPIPKELSKMVEDTINQQTKIISINKQKERKEKMMKRTVKTIGTSAAAIAVLTLTVNVSPVFAQTLSDIPVVGGIIKVLNFKEYNVDQKGTQAHINVPKVEGLKNKETEDKLNKELSQKGEESYQKFIEQIKELEGINGENTKLAVDVTYDVVTDTEDIFALKLTKTETQASASEETKFYVIDKKTENVVALKDLFKTDEYVKRISDEVIKQMKAQMKEDENKVYWVNDSDEDKFTAIAKDQNFYINKEGKLVISFNEYEVAPGYMGLVEFVIPTDTIQDISVQNAILK